MEALAILNLNTIQVISGVILSIATPVATVAALLVCCGDNRQNLVKSAKKLKNKKHNEQSNQVDLNRLSNDKVVIYLYLF